MTDSRPATHENSYRNVLKNTSLFGGFKMFEILINMVRGKFVAIILGPAGMGISALYTTTWQSINRVASLGLNLAVVKEVSASRDDRKRLENVVATARRMMFAAAMLGALVTVLAAPWLSELAFGSASYKWWFVLLGAAVFFQIAGTGEISMLQGLRDKRRLVRASFVGSAVGLAVGVPLYWLWGTDGIVPALVLWTLCTFSFAAFSMRRSMGTSAIRYMWRDNRPLVRKLLLTGLVLMSNDAIGSVCSLLTNAFLRLTGSLEDVGFFQAANSMTIQYAGVVFTTLTLDYLPRLVSVADDNRMLRTVVNRQAEIMSWLMLPLASLLVLFAPLVVHLLLASSFMAIVPMLRLMAVALIFRAMGAPLAYIAFARDNRRLFFWLEGVGGNLLTLVLSCGMYMAFGLIGLGVAMLADNLICFVVYYAVNRRVYRFRFSAAALRANAAATATGALVLAASYVPEATVAYALMGLFTLSGGVLALLRLKRLWGRDAA